MTTEPSSENEKPASMARADVANGEAPDTEATSRRDQRGGQPGPDQHGSAHPTGEEQARINQEEDPPA